VIERLRSDLTPGSALRRSTAGLEAALARIGLPAWFIAIDLLWVIRPSTVGIDARHYQRATSEWLAGGDPWGVVEQGFPYAAGPHTLLLYLPTSWLPLQLSTALWLAIGGAASIWLIRRLGLPVWWVLFPPLTHAIWNGNPQTLMLALLIVGTSVAAGLAAITKLYALLPIAFHPRRLVVAGLVLLITLPVVPWQLYLEHGLGVGSHLGTAWNGSAWRFPILIPPTLISLWVLRRNGAEWFSVPAVFPATQFYYVSTALPALVGRPMLAALFAAPIPLIVPFAVITLAVRDWLTTKNASGSGFVAVSSGLEPRL
jgi:hypothetical protein